MTTLVRGRPLVALWIAVAVMLLGRLLDLRWHLANDEFEGTIQQLEAHWLVWLGVLVVLWGAAAGVRAGVDGIGFRLTLVSALLYVPVAIWHFVEHANGADPEAAHYLLAITQIGVLAGATTAAFELRPAQLSREP